MLANSRSITIGKSLSGPLRLACASISIETGHHGGIYWLQRRYDLDFYACMATDYRY